MTDTWHEYRLRQVLDLVAKDSALTPEEAKVLVREIDHLRFEALVTKLQEERRMKLPWYKRLAEILPIFWLTLELSRWITAIPFRPN